MTWIQCSRCGSLRNCRCHWPTPAPQRMSWPWPANNQRADLEALLRELLDAVDEQNRAGGLVPRLLGASRAARAALGDDRGAP